MQETSFVSASRTLALCAAVLVLVSGAVACLDIGAPQNTLQFQFGDQLSGDNSDENNSDDEGCAGDADCPLREICTESGVCDSGCRTNVDCETGEFCLGDPKKCTAGGECIADADCEGAEGPRCHPSLLICVPCLITNDCSGEEVCSISPACSLRERECVREDFSCGGCTEDAQCAPGRCDVESGACVDCGADADCPAGKYCDTDRQSCTQCVTDEHCISSLGGPSCLITEEEGGICVGCARDSDCGPEETCNSDTRSCGGCQSGSDCLGEGLECNGLSGLCYDTNCTFRDVPELLEFALEASYPSPHLSGSPIVAPIVDDSGDGRRDGADRAELLTLNTPPSSASPAARVLTLDAQTVWTASALTGGAVGAAIGDLDGDGRPETVLNRGGRVVIHDNAGSTISTSGTQTNHLPGIFDVDQDGFGEIVVGGAVYSEIGARVWQGAGDQGGHTDLGLPGYGVAAQLDGAVGLEVMAGGTIYSTLGEIICTNNGGDGYIAVGSLIDGQGPEIAVVTSDGAVRAMDTNCETLWGPVSPVDGAIGGGPPMINDIDEDGANEIVYVVDASTIAMVRADGAIGWTAPLQGAHPAAGCTSADLDGDGQHEILVSDAEGLKVLRASDGFELTAIPEGRSTLPLGVPVVADVDRDGSVEIVVASDRGGAGDVVVVLGDVRDRWIASRNIWNQRAYIASAINDDLSVPQTIEPWWEQGVPFSGQRTAGSVEPAPNLILSLVPDSEDATDCPDRYTVELRLYNRGSAPIEAGTQLVARWTDGQMLPLRAISNDVSLAPGDEVVIAMTFDDLIGPVSLAVSAERDEASELNAPECVQDDNVILLEEIGCPTTF